MKNDKEIVNALLSVLALVFIALLIGNLLIGYGYIIRDIFAQLP